ncbi:hypothetical protein [Streptomyces sp. KLOTTS4A1]|uniref:hypothetical protein n=1 Tax=Streptomyces sp. KLOTTS4A1 TaxID=3390996 RepID=UPI0039F54B7F
MRRQIAAAALLATVTVVATGCSTAEPEGAPQLAWAGGFCGEVQNLGSQLQLPKGDGDSPKEYQTEVVGFLDALDGQLGALEKNMENGEAPPVEGGQGAYDKALKRLREARDTLSATNEGLKKAKVTDKKSLEKALREAGDGIEKAGSYQGPAQDLRSHPELKKAFDEAPECAEVLADGGAQAAPSAG